MELLIVSSHSRTKDTQVQPNQTDIFDSEDRNEEEEK